MMEELWPEEEYDNPFHILKNLVYRARMALKTLCGEDDVEFISFEHNCYTWNMNIPCRVDAELFDAYWQKSKTAAEPDEKLEFARRAFEQYTGEFLPGLSHYSWVVSKSAYYASRYNQCAVSYTHLDAEASGERRAGGRQHLSRRRPRGGKRRLFQERSRRFGQQAYGGHLHRRRA